MKVDLTVRERILLPQILPSGGSIVMVAISDDLRDKVRLKVQDLEPAEYQEIDSPGSARTRIEFNPEISWGMEFSERETAIICDGLKQHHQSDSMPNDPAAFSLWKKFIGKVPDEAFREFDRKNKIPSA